MTNLAELLWEKRLNGGVVARAELNGIETLDQAYQILADQIAPEQIGGWKAGATAEAAMGIIGLDAPFFGSVDGRFVVDNDA